MRERVSLVAITPGRLTITMSIPPGKLVRIPSDITVFVFVGSNASHCRRAVSGSWLGDCSCK